MSFSNYAENAVLAQVFQGTALPWAAASTLYLAAYSADPGEAGSATTNEIAYGSYARVALTRATDFDLTGDTLSNANLEQFPQSTSAALDIAWVAIVDSASGAGNIIARMQVGTAIPTTVGVTPQFVPGSLTFTLA